jgi:hypothetical protein
MDFSLSLHNETFDIFGFGIKMNHLLSTISAALGLATAVISCIIVFYYSWKIYPSFFSQWDMYRTSGFAIFLGRLILATTLGWLTFTFLAGTFGLLPDTQPAAPVQAQTQPPLITTYPAAEFKNYKQVEKPYSNNTSENTYEISEKNTAIAAPKKSHYTEEEMNELEDKVQYHGTDPVVRSRLGLPPKE